MNIRRNLSISLFTTISGILGSYLLADVDDDTTGEGRADNGKVDEEEGRGVEGNKELEDEETSLEVVSCSQTADDGRWLLGVTNPDEDCVANFDEDCEGRE